VFISLVVPKEMLERQACGGFKTAVLSVLLHSSLRTSVRRLIRCQDFGEQGPLIF